MNILGIESSCDDTAVAIVNDKKEILANVIYSQIETHMLYGGVVPEIAARAHSEKIYPVIQAALKTSGIKINDIDAIAATAGPGLIGGLIVATSFAKMLSLSLSIPYIPINHLEGHALTARLTDNVQYPYILFLTSGGHCQTMLVEALGRYSTIGRTIDDAIGESFDKVAKMLDLSPVGGVIIEQFAKNGDPNRLKFPKPLKSKKDFSFSGLKTAVRLAIEKLEPLSEQDKRDVCASFQKTVCDIVADKCEQILKDAQFNHIQTFVIGGGVGANVEICKTLRSICKKHGKNFIAPPIKLCTDNAAMIAWAGVEHLTNGFDEQLSFKPNPNWKL